MPGAIHVQLRRTHFWYKLNINIFGKWDWYRLKASSSKFYSLRARPSIMSCIKENSYDKFDRLFISTNWVLRLFQYKEKLISSNIIHIYKQGKKIIQASKNRFQTINFVFWRKKNEMKKIDIELIFCSTWTIHSNMSIVVLISTLF